MSSILCSELDYRAVKIFLSGQSFFLGLSQVVGQAHNCLVTCMSVYFYISVCARYNSCCSGGFHAVRALNQSYPRQDAGQIWKGYCPPLLWLLYWNIVRVHVTYFGWCTVCSPAGILWKTSTREISIFVGTKCHSPSSPCRLKFCKCPSWQTL